MASDLTADSTTSFASPQSRWLAVSRRTPLAHSSFLYGVKSTKIYCRPTCGARLARRMNVVFYDTVDQAQRDGFRPCKRCKPDDAAFIGAGEDVVGQILALLRTKRDGSAVKGGVAALAKEVGVTPSYLCRVFKKTMGMTLGAYAREFEKGTDDAEVLGLEPSPQSSEMSMARNTPELLMPGSLSTSASPPVEQDKENREHDMQEMGGIPDPDSDYNLDNSSSNQEFNLDEWIWTDFLDSEKGFGIGEEVPPGNNGYDSDMIMLAKLERYCYSADT